MVKSDFALTFCSNSLKQEFLDSKEQEQIVFYRAGFVGEGGVRSGDIMFSFLLGNENMPVDCVVD